MNQQQNQNSTTEMAQRMVEFPMDQAIEYQSNLGRLMLSGLTMSDWVQSQGIEMTRRTIDTYLRTLQNATEQISQSSAAAASTAQQAQQGMREMQGQQGQPPQSRQTYHGAPQPRQQYQQPGQQTPPQQGPTSFHGTPQPIPQTQQPPRQVPQEQHYQQEGWVTAPQETGTDRQQENLQQAENPPTQPQE